MTIEGGLNDMGGTLAFSMSGMNAGAFDQLVATGDVSLTDTTVSVTFVDGYLPTTGDMAPLVMAGGTLTVVNPMLEFVGVAAGFEFDVSEQGGMLMFEARNNAQALPQPPVGCSAGGGSGGASVMFPLLFVAVALMLMRREKVRSRG